MTHRREEGFVLHWGYVTVAAIHLIDGRIQHALVGELFTKEGVGSLISRQISDTAQGAS